MVVCQSRDKLQILQRLLQQRSINDKRILIFTRTKRTADWLASALQEQELSAAAMHADKRQEERVSILERFKAGDVPILVATDVASRGIGYVQITMVADFFCCRCQEHRSCYQF